MMRWHRRCAAIGAILMAYIVLTGLGIQLADMRALVSGAPASDPDMLMMRQHIYGPPNYAVLSAPDFAAPPLATGDVSAGLIRAASLGHAIAPGEPLRLVELRTVGGHVAGHVQMGAKHYLFDLAAGNRLPDSALPPPEPSRGASATRATFKFFHRFNYLGQLATGLNGLAGIAFAIMIVTGLTHYVRLFRARTAKGRGSAFWRGGGWVRVGHRWLAVAASLPILWIVTSGTLLSIDNVGAFVHGIGRPPPHGIDAFEGDWSSPIPDSMIPRMTEVTMRSYDHQHPGLEPKVIRLRYFAGYPQGVVIADNGETQQYVYNAQNGVPMSMHETGYPNLGFPSGWEWHQRLKRIHRGDIFGMPGRWLDTIGAIALAYLTLSGIWMYGRLWNARRRSGRTALVW